MSHFEIFESLRGRGARVAIDELTALYDALPAVDCAEMIGEWEGGAFDTGHPGEAQLAAMQWVGKHFRGVDDVLPIVCRAPDGSRAPSPVMGAATLRRVEHRGVVTATMVYDKHPIFDHFRRIDEGLVLGFMDRKGDDIPLYFWLRRM